MCRRRRRPHIAHARTQPSRPNAAHVNDNHRIKTQKNGGEQIEIESARHSKQKQGTPNNGRIKALRKMHKYKFGTFSTKTAKKSKITEISKLRADTQRHVKVIPNDRKRGGLKQHYRLDTLNLLL
jgi:hypothetical protein